ncbi:MAG: D-glycerate dehydrogenase [Bacteroidetes bacterium]|nr:D-glycerate dehydrogenase [Bacteroidota bacterium]MDA1119430.1 D-glycerate dehydrogenase [Bacteroidota bacterium]
MKVLVTLDIPEVGIELLKAEGCEVTIWKEIPPMSPLKLITAAKQHDALLCGSPDKIDSNFLNECSHLYVISQFAAGYDNINLSEATKVGIPVGNAPKAMSKSTGDISFALMLAVSRKMFFQHKRIISGDWGHFVPKAFLGMELHGKTLGVFGLGSIGFEMAKRCKGAYDMDILYSNRSNNPKAEDELGARLVGLDELLAQSDVVSVHCSLNDQTRGLFNMECFKKMKKSSIFINSSRGPVHNEEDLTEALTKGIIWGAGLDVTNPEPMDKNNPLLLMENVAVTPHLGSTTAEARNEMSRLAAQNIISFKRGEKIPNFLNPEVLSN